MKESQPEEMGIKKEIPSKNKHFLRANGKFITSGIIALLSTITTCIVAPIFYIYLLGEYWPDYTFIRIIDLALGFLISLVLSIIILILSIRGILRNLQEKRGEINDT